MVWSRTEKRRGRCGEKDDGLLGRQLPDDNRNMMISRSSGRSGFIYMVNV